jgi:hypothetical protein
MYSSNSSLYIADCIIEGLRISTNLIESIYVDNNTIEIKNTLIKNISNSDYFAAPIKLINL